MARFLGSNLFDKTVNAFSASIERRKNLKMWPKSNSDSIAHQSDASNIKFQFKARGKGFCSSRTDRGRVLFYRNCFHKLGGTVIACHCCGKPGHFIIYCRVRTTSKEMNANDHLHQSYSSSCDVRWNFQESRIKFASYQSIEKVFISNLFTPFRLKTKTTSSTQ